MSWLQSNWRWVTLNLFASSVLIGVATQGSTDWNSKTIDPELESGKWAIRFLLTCLAVTPLNTYLNWKNMVKLRKPAGLWAFAFAILHVSFYISDAKLTWLSLPMHPFMMLGLAGFAVLAALAITSNRWAMRQLGKNWKRLHKLVYLASVAVTSHAILATTASKKIALRDPRSIDELKIYLGVLAILLVVRLPQVRHAVKEVAMQWRSRRQLDLPVVSIAVPKNLPKYPTTIYMRDVEIPVNEYSREFQFAQNIETDQDTTSTPTDLPLAR